MVWCLAGSCGHIGFLCSSKLVLDGAGLYQSTECIVIGGICDVQHEDQH